MTINSLNPEYHSLNLLLTIEYKKHMWDHNMRKFLKYRLVNSSKNEQYHRKELIRNFYLNGHILGFRPQTQKLENLLVQHNEQHHRKSTAQ